MQQEFLNNYGQAKKTQTFIKCNCTRFPAKSTTSGATYNQNNQHLHGLSFGQLSSDNILEIWNTMADTEFSEGVGLMGHAKCMSEGVGPREGKSPSTVGAKLLPRKFFRFFSQYSGFLCNFDMVINTHIFVAIPASLPKKNLDFLTQWCFFDRTIMQSCI